MDTDEIFDMRSRTPSTSQTSFNINKHKNLFDELEKAEHVNKHRIVNSEEEMEVEQNRESNKRKRSETKRLRGKESIFKRPEQPLSKCLPLRKLPDFKRHPNKWTKYSLDTVRGEDISEKANTTAALSFLKELEERKAQDEESEKCTNEKPTFQVTALVSKDDSDPVDEKACFKGSKIIMPEYVVGQKKKGPKKTVQHKEESNQGKEIKLNHLLEYDDE